MKERNDETITNPGLLKALQDVKAGDSHEAQSRVLQELLKARLLIPVTVQQARPASAPERRASGEKNKLLFHMIQNTAKEKYFLAFTHMEELQKWRSDPNQKTAVLTFDDYAALVLDANSGTAGIAINPMGENLIITRETVRTLRRDKRMRESGGIDLSAIYPKLYS